MSVPHSMFAGKPIIGLAGGIGAGKSFVADLLAHEGCKVIRSDDLVRDAYREPKLIATLKGWWGSGILRSDGSIDRAKVAQKVFEKPHERERLEKLLHPLVARRRDAIMREFSDNFDVVAFVWDTPLLFETSLEQSCDAVVFVDAPLDARLDRVRRRRGWDEAELHRRENLQFPLDKKRAISDYVVTNTVDAPSVAGQVRDVLSRVISGYRRNPTPG